MTKSTGVRRRRGTGSVGISGVKYSSGGKQRYAHVLIAEAVYGKPLPSAAVVHHVDGDNKNNSHANLVICNDQSYHMLIHTRTRAHDECGHASWRKCPICKQYDDPSIMKKNGKSYRHAACIAEYNRRYK